METPRPTWQWRIPSARHRQSHSQPNEIEFDKHEHQHPLRGQLRVARGRRLRRRQEQRPRGRDGQRERCLRRAGNRFPHLPVPDHAHCRQPPVASGRGLRRRPAPLPRRGRDQLHGRPGLPDTRTTAVRPTEVVPHWERDVLRHHLRFRWRWPPRLRGHQPDGPDHHHLLRQRQGQLRDATLDTYFHPLAVRARRGRPQRRRLRRPRGHQLSRIRHHRPARGPGRAATLRPRQSQRSRRSG